MFRKVALDAKLDNQSGYISVPLENRDLVGKSGMATTILRPAGKVSVAGKVYDAIAEESYIEKGTPVKVTRYEKGQIYVIAE